MILTITNQKGGAGKTTTAAAIAAGLSLKGFRTLLIDLDAQGNLSYTAGANTEGASVFGVLAGEVKARDAVQKIEGGEIIPSSKALAGADAIFTATGKEYRLKEALEEIRGEYDYIIIDTPPALGILTVNALTASDAVIIPAQADIYSLQGIERLAETIRTVKKYCNPALTVKGIVLTRYSPRAVLSRDIADHAQTLAAQIGTKVYSTRIREAIAVKEAQICRQTLYAYAPKAKVTEDYQALVEEIIKE